MVVVAGVVAIDGAVEVVVIAAGVDATAAGVSVVVVLAATLDCVVVEFIIVVDLLSVCGSVIVSGTVIGELPNLAGLPRIELTSDCVQAATNHITQDMTVTAAPINSFLYLDILISLSASMVQSIASNYM